MSVAFRRDGDDEHLEPSFELPIPPGPNRVTARGLAQICARLAAAEAHVAALSDADAIKTARRDLRYWQTRHATADLMPVPDGDMVAFGTRVSFTLNGKARSVAIVGDDEADPAQGYLAFSAPLARAMMDAEVGDLLPFGGRDDAIRIEAIAPIAGDDGTPLPD